MKNISIQPEKLKKSFPAFKQILFGFAVFVCNMLAAQPGALDPTFNSTDAGNGAGNGANGGVRATAIQPDGKIIIGGNFTTFDGITRNYIARLNANRSIDVTFNPGMGANSTVLTTSLQPDGKIIIGGDFTSFDGITRNRIARLNPDGSLDANFNPGTGANGTVNTIVLQPDGKILVGGSFTNFNGTALCGIIRLNADGSYDSGFNQVFAGFGGGIGTANFTDGTVLAIALQGDGKIIIGGEFNQYNAQSARRLARLNSDGSLDFGGGFYSLPQPDLHYAAVRSVAIQPDGKLLVAGDFQYLLGTSVGSLVRLNADWSLDVSFDANVGTFGGTSGVLYPVISSICLQPDGKILLGGNFIYDNFSTSEYNLIRLNSDGSYDGNFQAYFSGNGSYDVHVFSLSLFPDGDILVGGDFNLSDGSLKYIGKLGVYGYRDSFFNGIPGTNGMLSTTSLQTDGKIIIGGAFTTFNGITRNGIARLNADGSLDATFNPGSGASSGVETTALQPDGKVLIGGAFTTFNGITRNRIARLNADGSLDATFNPGTGANSSVWSTALQPDGKVLIGGPFTTFNGITRNRIARLNADGSIDVTFDPGTGADTTICGIAIQPDGKILVFGHFTTFNGITRNRIARLNADGSLDAFFYPGLGADNSVFTTAIQPDGKIIIGGVFSSYNGTGRNNIARLNADGLLDGSFNPGTGAYGSVWSTALQPDGKIIIGGYFITYNGTGRNNMARVVGGEPLLIFNSINSCTGFFYDSGGSSGQYNNFEKCITNIAPDAGNLFSQVTFTSFDLENNYDFLKIYNGPDTTAALIGVYTGSVSPGVVTSTHPSGSLTFYFTSDYSVIGGGWQASIACVHTPPVITSFSPLSAKPGDLVTITGSGFNTTANNNIVHFGATKASVLSATSTSLSVNVPAGASYAPVTICNATTKLSCSSSKNFNPIFAPAKSGLTASDFQAKVDFPSGLSPSAIAIKDMDGDGKSDLIVVNQGSNTISLLRNTSSSGSITTGSFANKVDYAAGLSPSALAVGDVNGDGKPDLAVTNSSDSTLSVFINNTTTGIINAQSLNPSVNFATGQGPGSVAMGDIDGDGKADLLVSNGNGNTISAYRNLYASGSFDNTSLSTKFDFSVGSNLFTPYAPNSVALSDMDGDGKQDMVISLVGQFYVWRNTASMYNINSTSFDFSVAINAGSNNPYVLAGDIDGDTKSDIIIPHGVSGSSVYIGQNNSSVGLLTNNNFSVGVDFTSVDQSTSASFGDFDGNGKPDLLVGGIATGVAVHRNISTSGIISSNSFAPKIDLPTGTITSAVAAGDIDGDGKPDLVMRNGNSSIAVMRNADISLNTTSVSNSTFCPGAALTIGYTTTQPLSPGNVFTAQLSDASGSFANPVSIGTFISTGSGNINVIIPISAPPGNAYRIRVVSSSPAVAGSDNGTNLTISSTPSAPTASAQSFCSSSNPTIANLAATGSNIQWYASASGGAPLSGSTLLSNGNNYHASQTVGSCESASRTAVAVTINTSPSAPTASAQSFCSSSNPTIANLVATGSNIQWYASASGGAPLSGSTLLSNGNTYHASQTVGSCESASRTAVAVTINTSPSAPTASAQSFCSSSNPTIANLVATGSNIQWYASASGGAPLAGSTLLSNGNTYHASQSIGGCESASRTAVAVTIINGFTPLINITAAPGSSICAGNPVTISSSITYGGAQPSYQWQVNGNSVGTNAPFYVSNTLSNGDVITCMLTSSLACVTSSTVTSNALTINVVSNLVPQISISANNSNICTGEMVTFTSSILNGGTNPQYQWKRNGNNVGFNLPQFSSTSLQNGDVITCTLTSSLACASPQQASSAGISVTVIPNNFSPAFSADMTNLTQPPFNVAFTNNTPNASAYTYLWNFGDGTTSSQVNPSHQYATSGAYTVSLIATGILSGCKDTLTQYNYINCSNATSSCNHLVQMSPAASVAACINGTIRLSVITNAQVPSYQWMVNGVLIGGATQNYFDAIASGNYSAIVYENGTCPVTSQSVNLQFVLPPASVPTVSTSGFLQPCGQGSVTLTANATGAALLWNNGFTTNSITVTQGGNYSVTATYGLGCQASSEVTTISSSFAPNPGICLVTVDSITNSNRVVWTNPVSSEIDSFLVFKEGVQSNVYNQIGVVAYDSLSEFNDLQSNPLIQGYRYKLAAKDTCGGITPMSTHHKTIHLQIFPGPGNSRQLSWSAYEGVNFSSYEIYRRLPGQSFQLLTTLPSNLFSFTDLNPPSLDADYRIEIVLPQQCSSGGRFQAAGRSRSNIGNNQALLIGNIPVGIKEVSFANLRLQPNPSEGRAELVWESRESEKVTLEVFSTEGRLVQASEVFAQAGLNRLGIVVDGPGMYYVKVSNASSTMLLKMINTPGIKQ